MWFVVIGCQTTDITLGPLKIWEVLTLILSVFLLRYVSKKILYLLFFFSFIFFITIIISYYSNDYFDDFGGLKSKYYISIARFVELLLCCSVTSIIYGFYNKSGLSFEFVVNEFIRKNVIFCFVILTLYFLDFVIGTQIVSYGESYRLRGFYVEGGPLGLYLSTLFLLSLFFCKKRKLAFLFFIMVIFCQSKAGYVMLALSLSLYLVLRTKKLNGFIEPRNKIRFFFFFSFCLLFTLNVIYVFANNYINDISNISSIVDERVDDKSLVMGRIAGSFIGYEIIKENPIFGVGLGNYSLVRNNKHYRQFFPSVDDWDLTGLGGVYNLLIENGFFGVFVFFVWFFYFFKLKGSGFLFAVLFVLPFLLGAQLYMIYPWVYCSFYLIWCKNESYIR